jgi:hypothetical protein
MLNVQGTDAGLCNVKFMFHYSKTLCLQMTYTIVDQAFMLLKIHAVVGYDTNVDGYHHFTGMYCFHLQVTWCHSPQEYNMKVLYLLDCKRNSFYFCLNSEIEGHLKFNH